MEFVESFRALPLVTRSWLGLTLGITAAVTLDVLPVQAIVLDWSRVADPNRPELWRLLTTFGYCGRPLTDIGSLFLLYTIYLHGQGYEHNPFPAGSHRGSNNRHNNSNNSNRNADTVFVYGICMVFLLATQPLPGYWLGRKHALSPVLTRSLLGSILYLWSKRNPRAPIRLNFLPMEGRYLPFAHIGMSLCLQNRWHELVHGFVVAHFVYFWIAVAPVFMNGRRILSTPRLLTELLGGGEGGDEEYEEEYEQQRETVSDSGGGGGMERHHQHQHEHPQAEVDPSAARRRRERDAMVHDGATAAHIAAKFGDLERLEQLVGASSEARRLRMLTAPDRNGWQPLHEACRGGHSDMVEYLVIEQRNYVDRHATTHIGQSPLALAREYHGDDHPITQLLLRQHHPSHPTAAQQQRREEEEEEEEEIDSTNE